MTGRELPKMQQQHRQVDVVTAFHPREKEALSPGRGSRTVVTAADAAVTYGPCSGRYGVPRVPGTLGTRVGWYGPYTTPGAYIAGCSAPLCGARLVDARE